jgi:hypothetical protein
MQTSMDYDCYVKKMSSHRVLSPHILKHQAREDIKKKLESFCFTPVTGQSGLILRRTMKNKNTTQKKKTFKRRILNVNYKKKIKDLLKSFEFLFININIFNKFCT